MTIRVRREATCGSGLESILTDPSDAKAKAKAGLNLVRLRRRGVEVGPIGPLRIEDYAAILGSSRVA